MTTLSNDQQDRRRDLTVHVIYAGVTLLVLAGIIAWLATRIGSWDGTDTAILWTAAFTAMACALPGNFLVLRKLSMMGDAISHAVLPGLVLAFLFTQSRASLPMFIGAAVVGVLTAFFTQAVTSLGKVEESAAMGVVFTSLFAFGLLLIRRFVDDIDLDANCVLYGEISLAMMDTVQVAGHAIPLALLINAGVFLMNLVFVIVLYKEFKISSFDPALATTQGIDARWMHYLLMTLVAVTTVACFESVGSILVIAMLIVPPAVAHLLTDRLPTMIIVSLVVAALSAVLGHLGAMTVPGMFGYTQTNLYGDTVSLTTSTSGMMAVSAGLLLLAAAVFAPRHGLLTKQVRQLALGLRIAREDILGQLYRAEESAAAPMPATGSRWQLAAAMLILRRRGLVCRTDSRPALTELGRRLARQIIRSHRLWETYGQVHMGKPLDDLHYTAESFEHITDPDLQARLADRVAGAAQDPHGHDIPDKD